MGLARAGEGKQGVRQGVSSPLASSQFGEMSNAISSTPRALHTYTPTRMHIHSTPISHHSPESQGPPHNLDVTYPTAASGEFAEDFLSRPSTDTP